MDLEAVCSSIISLVIGIQIFLTKNDVHKLRVLHLVAVALLPSPSGSGMS